jgi:hypothetical protein
MDLDVPELKCAYELERDIHIVALHHYWNLSKMHQNNYMYVPSLNLE